MRRQQSAAIRRDARASRQFSSAQFVNRTPSHIPRLPNTKQLRTTHIHQLRTSGIGGAQHAYPTQDNPDGLYGHGSLGILASASCSRLRRQRARRRRRRQLAMEGRASSGRSCSRIWCAQCAWQGCSCIFRHPSFVNWMEAAEAEFTDSFYRQNAATVSAMQR